MIFEINALTLLIETCKTIIIGIMKEEKIISKEKTAKSKMQKPKKKVNKTWEAFGKLKGSLIVNDPKFLL